MSEKLNTKKLQTFAFRRWTFATLPFEAQGVPVVAVGTGDLGESTD